MTTTKDAEPEINKELIQAHGITDEEYAEIVKLLGREPNFTEIGMFSVMWSEHCSYKNSKPILKLFPTKGDRIMIGAGEENAGCVDIGDNLAVVFKIESHNHPSAIEPFQGAATGVGGILRDIFTMGARPVLVMNSLRFGSLDNPHVKRLLKGVVGGIAHYGNCMGIPTVGGEVYFDESYEGNPLVNAMSLGLVTHDQVKCGKATGAGNPVYYVGSTTGRDGLGGAAFASRELTEESHEDRPAVQVGDPFMEKLLLEACLELIATGAVVGIQDMGAAGLTCSTCETASRGNSGIQIDIGKVPRRDTGMIPYEVMLSESQERMLIIAQKGREKEVEDIFEKWDLHAVNIGEVEDGEIMKVYDGEKLVVEIPAKSLTDGAPPCARDEKEPEYLKEATELDLSKVPEPEDYGKVLKKLLDFPSIASKHWVYEQYDHMVRTDTVLMPGHDAGVIRIKGTRKAIAVSTDCNGLYCWLDPLEGGKIAVAESARNVVCSGAKPLAITNCLNFGNPMKPEIFWQFRKCVEGMTEACKRFGTPVTGGNVSFYNENPKGAVYPTPTVGMVGLIDDVDLLLKSNFQEEGNVIFLIGENLNELGASQYLIAEHGIKRGKTPRIDLETEAILHEFVNVANKERLLESAHDVSDGGLAVALAECCFNHPDKPKGCDISLETLTEEGLRMDALLFGETQSRVIVTIKSKNRAKFADLISSSGLIWKEIGLVKGSKLKIGNVVNEDVSKLQEIYREAIERRVRL